MQNWDIGNASSSLLADSIVWDNHGCMPLRCESSFLPQLERYKQSGVTIVSINIGFGEMPLADHIKVLAYFRRWILNHPDDYVIVRTADDIRRAKSEGKLAVAFDMEGARGIEDQIGLISIYYDLGVRWMLIAYNKNNLVGGGCHDNDPGLSEFGRQVLDEMKHVGMVTCCSHTGLRTTMEVMEYSQNPVIFSHSNPRAVWDHQRNVPDEALKACAQTGGVIGINGIGIFLGENSSSTEIFIRHIDYVASLIGPQHVGLGLDYIFDREELDEILEKQKSSFPSGMGYEPGIDMIEPERIPEICEALLKRGYAERDVRGILGENFLRVARQVWK